MKTGLGFSEATADGLLLAFAVQVLLLGAELWCVWLPRSGSVCLSDHCRPPSAQPVVPFSWSAVSVHLAQQLRAVMKLTWRMGFRPGPRCG